MIQFILNNQKVLVDPKKSGMAFLDFLRKDKKLKGMKLVCKEGECGACTVLVGELKEDQVIYQSMTACIMPLANAHRKHIVTIEGINMDGLNKVQEEMVLQNGTQCGFCTPGFVVSMTGALLTGEVVSQENMIKNMDGNICRCTGYHSIMRASENIVTDIGGKAKSINTLIKKRYLPEYFKTIKKQLKSIATERDSSGILKRKEGIRLGGGTDLYVQKPNELYEAEPNHMYDKSSLNQIKIVGKEFRFGASVTMGDLYRSKEFNQSVPGQEEFFKLLSSTQIRNMATIGGNLMNASPIGDFTIFLLGLDAKIILANGAKKRKIFLKDFYLDYKKMDFKKGEYLKEIHFTIPQKENNFFSFEKVSLRKYLDIAGVNSACQITLDDQNKIKEAHISAGGVGPIPWYLKKTRKFLIGKPFNKTTIDKTLDVINKEITPISDARGTADYKRLLLRQLFLAHCLKIDENIYDLTTLIRS